MGEGVTKTMLAGAGASAPSEGSNGEMGTRRAGQGRGRGGVMRSGGVHEARDRYRGVGT